MGFPGKSVGEKGLHYSFSGVLSAVYFQQKIDCNASGLGVGQTNAMRCLEWYKNYLQNFLKNLDISQCKWYIMYMVVICYFMTYNNR